MFDAIDPRRALVLAVAISLTLPLVPMAEDGAEAQSLTMCDFEEDPLWITSVEVQESTDPNSDMVVTEDQAVFAEKGDELTFFLTVENRVPSEDCSSYESHRSDELRIQVQYLPQGADTATSNLAADPKNDEAQLNCDKPAANSTSLQPDQYCQVEVSLPQEAGEQIVGDPGEHRVRFLIWDEDANTDADSGFGELERCGEASDPRACTGAERVIVVEKRPNMVIDGVELATDEPTTTYDHTKTAFDVDIGNEGTYPNWNPNGGRGDGQFALRSSYDDNDPDHDAEEGESETTYHYSRDSADHGPSCNWLGSNSDADYVCSYRHGDALDTPLSYEVKPNGEDTVIETGESNLYYDNRGATAFDKGSTRVVQNGSTVREQNFLALDRYKRAGQFRMEAFVDATETGYGAIPEQNENDNSGTEIAKVIGVDLELTKHNLFVQTDDKQATNCPESDPCPVGSNIKLNPEFENAGSPKTDDTYGGLRDVDWQAAVFLDGERELTRDYADGSRADDLPIPEVQDGSEKFWSRQKIISPSNQGGPANITIRLDHPDNYDDAILDHRGAVGEQSESHRCGPNIDIDEADNAWCITLYFEDQNPPDIQSTSIETDSDDGDVPHVIEGENVTFEAEIVGPNGNPDNSLKEDGVTAILEHPNGTPANFTGPDGETLHEIPMERSENDRKDWRAETTLRGEPGDYIFKVRAEDINHTVTSNGMEFEVTPLPTDVQVDPPAGTGFSVNGESSFGSDPPQYQGTAEDPDNVFEIGASINETGHEDPETVAENTSIEIVRPDGTTAAWADVETVERCAYANADGSRTYETGSDCQSGDTEPGEGPETNWTVYRLDSSSADIELDWVGTFDVVYHVTDKNGRNATPFPTTGVIADRPNDDGSVTPNLENATVSPKSVDPGGTVTASAEAYDALRVENVTLNITKPSGATVSAPLQVQQLDDQTTLNGTYADSFEVDPQATYFEQGGTYQVQLEAEDFAGKTSTGPEVSVAVNDTDKPTITEFRTVPADTQEVGGPITWVADIDDQTAVKPPVLRVDRPQSGPTGALEMTYNETRERWTYGPINASEVDVGTWTYDLTVEDYTGKQATAGGELQVKENLPPQTRNWAPDVSGPADGSYGPPAPTIRVDVVDYGQGVNKSSIAFAVNGEDRTAAAEIATIGACEACYRIKYTPSEAFDSGTTVDVKVEASDLSEPPRESGELHHQFQVDGEAPTADLQLGPAVTRGEQRVIGLPTDLTVSVSDGGSGAGETAVTVTDAEASGASQTITLASGEGTLRLQEFDEVVDSHGAYQISVEARDAVNNTADPVQQPVLFDKLGPSIEVFAEPGKPREVVFANVTDDADIQKVEARYHVDDGPEQALALELKDDTWTGRLYNQRTDQAFQEGAHVRFTVEATDVFGNVRSSPEKNFTAGDSVPSVDLETPAEGATISDKTEISWAAEDAETPRDELRISLFYKKPGGTFQEIPNAQDIPNRGSYRLDTTGLPNGELTLQVFVLDGQNFAADEVNVTVRNLGETFSAPEIQDSRQEDGRQIVAPSQETVFSVQIDGNVQRAWANVTENGEVVQTIELENAGGSTWEGSFVAPSERGNYSVSLSAVTADGVQEADSAYAFSVQGDAYEGDNFIPEWTLLTALTATAVALGVLGLRSRWT